MKTIESVFRGFDVSAIGEEKPECVPLTLWMPVEYKAKFDMLQVQSRRRFGKLLKEVVKQSIDRLTDERDASKESA